MPKNNKTIAVALVWSLFFGHVAGLILIIHQEMRFPSVPVKKHLAAYYYESSDQDLQKMVKVKKGQNIA